MFSKQENQGLACWPHSLTRLFTVDLSKQEEEEEEEIKDTTKRMFSAKKCATVYHTTPMETLVRPIRTHWQIHCVSFFNHCAVVL